jgi:hypothetical protein
VLHHPGSAGLLLPLSPLARVSSFVRVVPISVAVVSIASYFYVGVLDAVGHVDRIIEVLLVLLVTVDAATSGAEEDLAGGSRAVLPARPFNW